MIGRSEDDPRQKSQRFLRGVLAACFFPPANGRHTPNICHLLTVVQGFHGVIIKHMWYLLELPGPNDELRGICEKAARYVCGWICFLPCYDIQDFIAERRETVCHGKNIMIGATYPYCAAVLQFVTTQLQPFHVKGHYFFLCFSFVPVSLVHADYLSTL